jgi:hypothetical protein
MGVGIQPLAGGGWAKSLSADSVSVCRINTDYSIVGWSIAEHRQSHGGRVNY